MPQGNLRIPSWVLALLLVFSLSSFGLGISNLAGTYIPFWILFVFSLIFSLDRWFYNLLRRYKAIGILYRILLNLSIVFLIGIAIWTGIQLFSLQFTQSPLIGSLIFIGELAFLIWLWKIVAKNSWRSPSMKLTVFTLLIIVIIFAYAGVQPLLDYKNYAIGKITDFYNQQKYASQLKQESVTSKNSDTDKGDSSFNLPDVAETALSTSVNDYADRFNQYRQSKGLAPLEFTDDLNRAAKLRLAELCDDFSHYSAGGYNRHLAENIAMSTGYLSNSDALRMWQNAPGHNANMVKSGYKYSGYAIGYGYAVQLFTEYPTINSQPQLPSGWYWVD